MDSFMFMVFLIVVASAIVVLMRRFMSLGSERRPTMSSPAVVVSLRKKTIPYTGYHLDHRFGEPLDPEHRTRDEPVDWFIAFRLISGELLELSVPQKIYEAGIVGDEGNLEWIDDRAVRFTPTASEPMGELEA